MHSVPTAEHTDPTRFAEVAWQGATVRLEYQWVGKADATAPPVVFLHEGLGSIALWKDFPQAFCDANGLRGLVFSRYGYGRSTPRPAGERWPPAFMHAQAIDVLPALFDVLDIRKAWLFGHSDGGSIALLHASHFPERVSGIVVVAPHIFVEDMTIRSIEQARATYLSTDLRAKLSRYHHDPDSAFWGWNDIWLDPAFRDWNIEDEVARITCPILAIQGEDDEYGSLEQVFGIRRKAPHARVVSIPRCGHSPHRDQPAALMQEAGRFIVDAS